MDNSDDTLRLVQHLHQLLTEQALAITARRLDEVVRLSIECAGICPQLRPLLPVHDNEAAEQLLRACHHLQQRNSAALTGSTATAISVLACCAAHPLPTPDMPG